MGFLPGLRPGLSRVDLGVDDNGYHHHLPFLPLLQESGFILFVPQGTKQKNDARLGSLHKTPIETPSPAELLLSNQSTQVKVIRFECSAEH